MRKTKQTEQKEIGRVKLSDTQELVAFVVDNKKRHFSIVNKNMKDKNKRKDKEGFLYPCLVSVSGWLLGRTVYGLIRARYDKTKNRRYPDKWVLGNFVSSIVLWLIMPYVAYVGWRWMGWLIVGCSIWRVYESVLIPTLAVLFGDELAKRQGTKQEVHSPRRNAVYALMTYAGLSFWFAILYMKFYYLFYGGHIKLSSSLGSWYFSVVTMSTLGYGEIVPKVAWGRLIVIFQTMIGIFFALVILGSFISWINRPETPSK